jgi:hypothetical protein
VEEVAKILASHFVAELATAPYEIIFRRVSPGVLLDLPGLGVEAAEVCHHTAKEAHGFRLRAGVDVLFSGDTAAGCESLRRLGAGVDIAVLEATRNEENKPLCKKMPTPPPSRRWRRGGHEGGGAGAYTHRRPPQPDNISRRKEGKQTGSGG